MRIIFTSPLEQKEEQKKDYETYCVDMKRW